MRISVSNIKSDNQFGGRVITISTGSSSFKTPNRTATQKEYNYAGDLPHNVIITNPISEYIIDFNSLNIEDFLRGNGSFNRRYTSIENRLEHLINTMRQFPILSTIKIPIGKKIPKDKLKLFLELQKHPNINIISLPPFDYVNIDDFKKTLTDYSDMARQRGQETMPIIHIDSSPTFDLEMDAMKQLHENGLCNIIGFKYGSLKANIQRYNKIHNMKDENIWYHCFDIPRHPRKSCVSHLHELQNWGIDTISPVVKSFSKGQTGYLIMSSRQESVDSVQCDNRFDAPTLGVLNENTWRSRYREDLHCDCSVCKKAQDFNDFKEVYSHELNGNLNTKVLYGATRIHDLFSGSEELTVSRKAIESDNLNEYFEGKEFTRGRIKPPL